MSFDIDEVRHHADRFDISNDQKNELIHIVANIMQSFVDRAFGHDPVQQVLEKREAVSKSPKSLVLDFEKTALGDDIFRLSDKTSDNKEVNHDG